MIAEELALSCCLYQLVFTHNSKSVRQSKQISACDLLLRVLSDTSNQRSMKCASCTSWFDFGLLVTQNVSFLLFCLSTCKPVKMRLGRYLANLNLKVRENIAHCNSTKLDDLLTQISISKIVIIK